MSFDVFAQAFRDGHSGTAHAAGASAILSEIPHRHDPQGNSYYIEFEDGSRLEMHAGGLDGTKSFSGAMFAIRGVSAEIGDFIFRFARAAGCVLIPAMEPACVLLTDENQSKHLPTEVSEDFQVVMISSGGELLAALEGGHETWRAYRDQIVDRSVGGT